MNSSSCCQRDADTKYEIFSFKKLHHSWIVPSADWIRGPKFRPEKIELSPTMGWKVKTIMHSNETVSISLEHYFDRRIANKDIYSKFAIIFKQKNDKVLKVITDFFVFNKSSTFWERMNITHGVFDSFESNNLKIIVSMEIRKCTDSVPESPKYGVNGKRMDHHSYFPSILIMELLRFFNTENHVGKFALSLIKLADQNNLPKLKTICEKELIKTLTKENSLKLIVEAKQSKAEYLKNRAIEIIAMDKNLRTGELWTTFKNEHRDLADEIYEYALSHQEMPNKKTKRE